MRGVGSIRKNELIVRLYADDGDTWLSSDHGVRFCTHESEIRLILRYGRPDYINYI